MDRPKYIAIGRLSIAAGIDGDDVAAKSHVQKSAEGGAVKHATIAVLVGQYVRVDGQVKEQIPAGSAGVKTWPLAAGEVKWATVELRDAQTGLWAVTNPIFFGDWRA